MNRVCGAAADRDYQWRQLLLPDIIFRVSALVTSARPHEHDLEALRARCEDLERALDDRHNDIARVTAGLEAFRIRYRQAVGLLHEQLDDLEQAIDEIELGVMAKRLEAHAAADTAAVPGADSEPMPRLTSDAVRKLFRDVAKLIHPDLAPDDDARDRRHSLMIEANKAYARGDEERLRRILDAWENSPDSVQGDDPEAARLRLMRRIAQIEEQLDVYAARLAEMKGSPLGKLKAMVDEESAKGKDLIADMVRRLKRDILVAQNRLEAMRATP